MCNIKCAMAGCTDKVSGFMGRFGWLCHNHIGEVLEKFKIW